MADAGMIEAYLTELRLSITTAHGPAAAEADDIVDEAADHLHLVAEHLVDAGMARSEAEALAVARFGTPALVGRTHVLQARMGAAVATRFTRVVGGAMLWTPPLSIAAFLANSMGEAHAPGWRGAVHGSGAAVEGLAVIAFMFSLFGLFRRHAGLGRLGRASMGLVVASPFLAAPFGWGAGAALVVLLLVALGLLMLGVWQMAVLDRRPIATTGLGAALLLLGGIAGTVVGGEDAGWALIAPGIATSCFGYSWLGLVMLREHAMDAASGPSQTSLAT